MLHKQAARKMQKSEKCALVFNQTPERNFCCMFSSLLSIISSEMGWKWMKNVVLSDICLRKLTFEREWKPVIKEILDRPSAGGPKPVKQSKLFPFNFSVDEGILRECWGSFPGNFISKQPKWMGKTLEGGEAEENTSRARLKSGRSSRKSQKLI